LVPAKGQTPPFRRVINPTIELLSFSPLGALIPNRGSIHETIFFSGLSYAQQVTDLNTLAEIHVETGQWLNIPETNPPSGNASVVRQATILHGNAFIAQGPILPVLENIEPTISQVSFMPTFVANGQPLDDQASITELQAPAPQGVPPGFIADPNQILRDETQGKVFIKTRVLRISSDPSGGIVNIPFLAAPNAKVTRVDATFWIETIQRPPGGDTNLSTIMQLQYTQTASLLFDDINWPHISVATLVKQ
jgi:hypothetical protein